MTSFLSCDWGTSSFRLRCVTRSDLRVAAVVESRDGVRDLHLGLVQRGLSADRAARDAVFAGVLSQAIESMAQSGAEAGAGILEGAPVVISGMASSTVGWREVPYASTPCRLDGTSVRVEALEPLEVCGSRHPVWLVSGLSSGADMMRGEECELLGVLALPEFAALGRRALVVLPGTHSKHVRVEAGAVIGFRTFMTGELLELLSTRSLLGVSVEWPPLDFDEASFGAGLELARDAGLARGLFQVRVRSVLGGVAKPGNTWFLTGLLIGSELVELLAWEGDPEVPILLAASPKFAPTYRMALERYGVGSRLRVAGAEAMSTATVRAHALVLGGVER